MKLKYTLILLSFCVIAFTACNNDEKNNSPEFKNVTYTPTADDQIVGQAEFETDPTREVSGRVIVYKNSFQHVLRFEDFMIDNGPNLKVYLAQKIDDVSGNINLGDLVAASGNFNYVYSVNTDMSLYKFVLVYSEENSSIYCSASL